MQNKIIWEKWVDPFLPTEEESNNEDTSYKDSYEKAEEKARGVNENKHSGPVMIGPMGIIPITENNTPSKIYCFWMGHTNFDITYPIQNMIAECPGVEALDVFTRYRFRLAVGKAFIDEETDPFGKNVLLAVEKRVCPKQEKDVVIAANNLNNLGKIKQHLNKTYKYWIIFSKPDGTLEPKGGTTKEELIVEFDKRSEEAIATSWE